MDLRRPPLGPPLKSGAFFFASCGHVGSPLLAPRGLNAGVAGPVIKGAAEAAKTYKIQETALASSAREKA